MDELWQVVIGVFVVVVGIVLVIVICQAINITCVDNVPVICTVDGKVVYDGISAGIIAQSSGDTTSILVRGGFLYLFPKAFYVSHDVHMTGTKGGK